MGKKHSNKNNKREKKRFFKKRWLVYLAIFCLLMMGIAYLVFESLASPYRERAETYDLSKIDDVEVKSLILDVKGRELGRIFVENRDKISIDDVPETMINALVSGEDQRFFTHDGVDRQGVLRAIYLNFKAGRQTQGASTLTQQLARNAFHLKEEADKRGEGGMERKAVEAYLAMRIEREYSKREILEFYLNRIPFGSGYYGIRSAALGYFGKEPKDLTVSECGSLVGCIKNPTRISPLNSLEENQKARNQVLKRMMTEGFLSEIEGKPLLDQDVVVNPKPIRRGTSHLYERIASDVRKYLGEDALTEGGFKIYTTIDLDVQREMERSLLQQLATVESKEGYKHPKYESYRRSDGPPKYLQGVGMMIDNSDGSVVAYVGGRDFTHSQYDFVKSGSKPLGTAFLPFVYATALEQRKTAVSKLSDRPMDNRSVMVDGREGILGEWGMETLRPSYEGEIPLRRAFEVSKIAATVRLGSELGLSNVLDLGRRFGMGMKGAKLLPRILVGTEDVSIPEVIKAYSTFPNEGHMVKSFHFIDHIVDINGSSRYKAKKSNKLLQVLAKEYSYLMHTLLQGSLVQGAGVTKEGLVKMGSSIAGKTGTTYDFSNNWFVGYNNRVTCGMWMGFLDGSREAIYPGAFSRETLLPSWQSVMSLASDKLPTKEITKPETVVTIDICKDTGMRETRYCQDYTRDAMTGAESYKSTTYKESFVSGHEPKSYCDFHRISDSSLTEFHDYGVANQQLARSHSIPIQPKQPVLLGQDPYGSEQPGFAPRDKQVNRPRDILTFDALDEEDLDAAITLDRPARIPIYEN